METSHQSLSIESFSYSWLVNLKVPSLESLDNSLRTSLDASDEANSFIEMDPRMPPSKRFFRNSQDFKFDFPTSPSPLTFVHADELISNGYLMPLFLDPLKMEVYEASSSNESMSIINSLHSPKPGVPADNSDASSLRRCRRLLSRRIIQKYLNFLRPLYRRIRGHNKASAKAAVHVDKRGKNRVYSSETASPRISVAYSADNDCWRKSCDSDSSIYEAVLHCKRSIGN
ncbi:probable membrane-associated kinase regulator 6 [Humulus lupulus]|uniref:probable membrane-associated kinase regulator 6 n=1 Tax=Humulus lupulus TaxID=3486 RepID=UPI002B407B1F|nr:probable membrane-associated kinase regulator 6 [Humulus lupulus]